MEFSLGTSLDGKLAKVSFAKGAPANWTLNARDIEQLISSLSNARGKMLPPVRQSKSPLDSDLPAVDDLAPRIQCAKVADGQALVSVAFRGLGWRTFQLDPDEARKLGRTLLAIAGPASPP